MQKEEDKDGSHTAPTQMEAEGEEKFTVSVKLGGHPRHCTGFFMSLIIHFWPQEEKGKPNKAKCKMLAFI